MIINKKMSYTANRSRCQHSWSTA